MKTNYNTAEMKTADDRKRNAKIVYAYKVDHDLGMNPNPFGAFCTLAYCKGTMRKSIQKYVAEKQLKNPELSTRDLDIWVIGIAGMNLNLENKRGGKLLYAMQVTEILTFEDYWSDARFQYKTQLLNETERYIFDNGEDRKIKYAFWRNNKNRLVCGDKIVGTKDKATDYILVSDTFIYHGFDCYEQEDYFIHRLNYDVNDPIRPFLIFSDERNKPIPHDVSMYIQREFQDAKCLARPTFSAEDFEYKSTDELALQERLGSRENNPLPKRVRHC